jgi:RimJ/RimL family protein N-acetyltransferase
MDGAGQPAGGMKLIRLGAVIYGADAEVARWVAKQIPGYSPSPGAQALGVIKGGRLVAGVVFERCNGKHVEASIAARLDGRWADRRTLFALFDYPFNQLGCEAVTVTVPGSNLESLNLATKLGFEPVCYIPFAAHDASPLVVLQMYREKCGWLHHGRQEQQGSGPS